MFNSHLSDGPVICPYNKHHSIARSSIQKHIVKCEKNYPTDYKVMCPYNATHRLFKHEMVKHIITCSTRQLIEPELYQRTGSVALMKNKLHATSSSIDCCESWDEEFDFVPPVKTIVPPATRPKTNNTRKTNYEKLRAPISSAEAMLVETDTESAIEDLESVTSGMGMGRGKLLLGNKNCLPKIGLGQERL